MEIQETAIGPLEMKFLGWAQLGGRTQVRTGDLVAALRLNPQQEASLFYNLSTSGLILKLWRGFYLIPARLPVGGQWSPSPYLIINMYMKELGADYQISGPAVFNSYGLSTQLASELTIYNDRVSRKVKIRQYRFNFVKIEKKRLGAFKLFQPYGDGEESIAKFSDLERSLFDAVYDYKRFGTLPLAYSWIVATFKDKKIDLKKLAERTVQYGNSMSMKRVGWLLEKIGADRKIWEKLLEQIPKSKFLVPLDPANCNGPINAKWGVIENVALPTSR
jgi:predicted transcriptional regulator of viral defense system